MAGSMFRREAIQVEIASTGLATSSRALKEAAKALGQSRVGKNLVQSIEQGSIAASKAMADAITDASKASFTEAGRRVEALRSSWDRDMASHITDLQAAALQQESAAEAFKAAAKLNDKTANEQAQAAKDAADAEVKRIKLEINERERAFNREMRKEQDLIKARLDAVEEQRKMLKDARDDLKKTFTSDLPSNLQGGVQAAKSGDLGSVMEGAVKTMGKAGKAMGVAAGTIAAVAGVLALVVKLLIDAEAQAKEFNQALLEGAGAADMAWTKSRDGLASVGESLEAMRVSALDIGRAYRVLPKELLPVMAAANAAGLTYRELEEGADGAAEKVARYSQLLKVSLVYSKNLGVSSSEIAETTAKWHHDFGMGLQRIEDTFAAITSVAMQSGMATKRFFGMISQATSGMAIYNNRIEETAELLADLATVVGEDLAEALAQDLTKGFTQESYTERFKKIMIAGGGDMSDIMSRSLEDTARQFRQDFGSMDLGLGGDINRLMGSDLNDEGTARELAQRMGSVTQEELGKALAQMRLRGDDESARRLESMVNLARGTQGGMSEQAIGMGSLDMGGKLATMLQALGDRALSDMGAIELAAFEQYAGVSGEQLEALKRVDLAMRGQWDTLEGMRGENIVANSERDKRLAENFGATIRNGKVVAARVDEHGNVQTEDASGFQHELKGLGDYIQSNGDLLQATAEGSLSAADTRAKELTRQTTSVATILETGVQYWLEQIYQGIQSLYQATMAMGPEERAVQQEALDASQKVSEKLRSKLVEINNQLSDNRQQASQLAGDEVGARNKLKGDAAVFLQKKEGIQAKMKEQEALRGIIRDTASWDAPDSREEMVGEVEKELLRRSPDVADAVRKADAGVSPPLMDFGGYAYASGSVDGPGAAAYADKDRADAKRAEVVGPMAEVSDLLGDDSRQKTNVAEGIEDGMGGYVDSLLAEEKALQEEMVKIVGGTENIDTNLEGHVFKALKENRIDEALSAAGIHDSGLRQLYGEQMMAGRMHEDFAARLMTLKGSKSEALPPVLEEALIRAGQVDWLRTSNLLPGMDDFIYRGGAGGGSITPINRADEFIGMMPGGPADQAIAQGGGGSSTVNINVRNPQDMGKVYDVVRKAVNSATGRPN